MGLADLHIHTTYSWDATSSVASVLRYTAQRTNLDVIAITDHDRIDGALEALDLASKYNLEVIPGIEVSSKQGHVLSLFVGELIPAGLSMEETIIRTVEQGGICIIPHPMMKSSMGISPHYIRRTLNNPEVAKGLIGIEMFNAGLAGAQRDQLAIYFADKLPLAKVGNSDAHVNFIIGKGATKFPGHTAADLRQALINRQTESVGEHQMNWLDFFVRFMPRLFLRYTTSYIAWSNVLSKPLQHAKQDAF